VAEPNLSFSQTLDSVPPRKSLSQFPNARRSPRVVIDMPVEVVGKGAGGESFRQETRTTVVNAHGARLVLESATEIEPFIFLINKKTGTEVHCRVVYQKRIENGKAELGIEFVDPRPRFWGIAFPPEGWSRAERTIPGSPFK
jgi:hypothetical protein